MQARRLPARNGLLWLLASVGIFRRNPPLMTALSMGYMLTIVAINLFPLVGPFLLPLALPTLVVLLANGCRAIQRGGGVGVVALTFGLQKRRIELVRLGGLHLIGSLVILVISSLVEGGQPTLFGPNKTLDDDQMAAAMMRLMLIALPVVAAFWFAPLLTAWDDVAPLKAIFFSFIAAWRNWRTFAVYLLGAGFVAIAIPGVLLIAASAVADSLAHFLSIAIRVLMILVMAPVMMASVFISYQDVFHGEATRD